jgi:hypothetical protein
MTSGKYAALADHLRGLAGQGVTLSFGELKKILGFPLPSSASHHRTWWANHKADSRSQSRGWMDAGFTVEVVNLNSGTVRFVRKLGLPTVLGKGATQALVASSSPPATYNVQRQDGCHLDLAELQATAKEIVRLAGSELSGMQIAWTPAPHRRPAFPSGMQGVYCFFIGQHCLKVGKAGPKSPTRFTGQHYAVLAPSTLAKSILGGKDKVAKLLKEELREELHTTSEAAIGKWIEKSTSRLNVLLPAHAGPHVLSLVEAFLQVRLQPLFEGHG